AGTGRARSVLKTTNAMCFMTGSPCWCPFVVDDRGEILHGAHAPFRRRPGGDPSGAPACLAVSSEVPKASVPHGAAHPVYGWRYGHDGTDRVGLRRWKFQEERVATKSLPSWCKRGFVRLGPGGRKRPALLASVLRKQTQPYTPGTELSTSALRQECSGRAPSISVHAAQRGSLPTAWRDRGRSCASMRATAERGRDGHHPTLDLYFRDG